MPPLPAAAKVLRIAWEYGVEFQTNVNIFHLLYDGAGNNQSDLDGIGNDVSTAIKAFLNPLQDVDVVNQQLTITDLTSSTALTTSGAQTGNGTHAGGMTPANCACCVSWHIHRRYRGGHPRTYVGGIPITAYLDERSFTTTYVALAQTRGTTFITDMNAIAGNAYGTLTLVNLSYFTAGALRATPITDPILFSTTNARPDSQRRRLGKVAG